MIEDREKLIEEMAREVAALNGHSDDWDRFFWEARDYLAAAERALAEKHARIAVNELLKMQSTHAVTNAVYRAIRMSVPANLVASVEKKDE